MGEVRLLEIGPFRGSVSNREKIALKAGELNGVDSGEWMVDPEDGRLVRRGGSAIADDTITSGHETTGLLESKWGARAHQFVPLHVPGLANTAPTIGEFPSWLVCNESTKRGTLAWLDYDTNSGQQIAKLETDKTSSGHYRQDGAAGEVRAKIIPCIAEAAGIGYHRMTSASARTYPFAGSRRIIENDRGIYSPGAQAAPYWTNKVRNTSATSGSERFRAGPWGLPPAYWPPATTVPGSVAAAAANWVGGNRFWEIWRFVFASGEKGPWMRISTTATTAARGGLITVGASPDHHVYRTLAGIPLGPLDGPAGPCVAREGARSLQATATEPLPDFSTFYGFIRIDDNTSTTATDYFGDDTNLATGIDTTPQTWPPRAQIAAAIEGRTFLGGRIRFNPYALIIGPSGAGASRDLNLADTNTTGLYGTVFYHVRIVNTGTAATSLLYLKMTTGGVTTQYGYAFNTYATLQALADAVNETLFGGTADEWFCQIVPGVDGNISSLNLRATSDTGDEDDATVNTAPNDATTLNVRVYCPNYHMVAAFTEAYLATLPTDEIGLWASDGNPGNGGGLSKFYQGRPGDRKFPGHGTGKLQGIEPCTAPGGVAAIVFYENKKYELVNTKGGGSLDNADYILRLLDAAAGCVSHLSCGSGPGYAYCVDQQGPWVGDGNFGSAFRPMKDHYDEFPAPGQLAGELAYAIKTDSLLAAQGADTYTWMGLVGDKLRVRFRTANIASTYTDAGIDYWFGKSKYASGLASLQKDVDGNLTSFGCSCTNRSQKVGIHGVTTDSNGRHTWAWQETNAGATGDGRVDEVDMGSAANDNGTAFVSDAYTACLMSAPFQELALHRSEVAWRKNGSGLTITIWGDLDRALAISVLTLGTSSSSVVRRQVFEHPPAARGNLQCCEMRISDDGSGTGAVEVRGAPTEVETMSAATRY